MSTSSCVTPAIYSAVLPAAFSINPIAAATTRNFITLEAAASAHYELATPWVATGDFEVEFDFASFETSTRPLVSGENESNDGIYMDINGGKLRAFTYVGSGLAELLVSSGAVNDGKLKTAKLRYIGTTASLLINDVEVDSATWNLNGNQKVKFLGKRINRGQGSSSVKMSNLKLTDITTPSNSLTFGLDELTADYELPDENVFGAELFISPSAQSGWIINGDGTYSHSGALSELTVASSNPLKPSTVYEYEITVQGEGTVSVQLGGATTDGDNKSGGLGLNSTSTGFLRANSTITYNAIRIISATTVTVTSISVREVPNALNYVNIATTQDVRDTFTLVDEGWVGTNLITQDVWENPAVAGDQWTYNPVDNAWRLVGDGSLNAFSPLVGSAQPSIMLLQGSLTNVEGSGLTVQADVLNVIDAIGDYSKIIHKSTGLYQQYKRAGGSVNATLTKPTLQQLIEVSP